MFMSVLKQRCVMSKERLGVLDDGLYATIIQNRSFWMSDAPMVKPDESGGHVEEELGFVCGNLLGA